MRRIHRILRLPIMAPNMEVEERRRSHQWQLGGSEGASVAINGNHLPIIEVEERR